MIYDEHEVELTRVLPQAGLLVTFESERFPHQVLPAEYERFSIAGWLRDPHKPLKHINHLAHSLISNPTA